MSENYSAGDDRIRLPRNVASVNLYDLLGVSRDATSQEIRRARNREALRHHSDRNVAADTGDADRMASINLAYDILSSPQGRAAYDDLMTRGDDDDLMGIEDGSSSEAATPRAIGSLTSGQIQLSDKGQKLLVQWREKWAEVARKRNKDSYSLIFEADWAELRLKLVEKIPKVKQSDPSVDSEDFLAKTRAGMKSALELIQSYGNPEKGTFPKTCHVAIQAEQCIDRHHALIDRVCVDDQARRTISSAFGQEQLSMEQLLTGSYFPIGQCLTMKRSRKDLAKQAVEPEVKFSKVKTTKSLPALKFHGFSKTKEILCGKCGKKPGFFARLTDAKVEDKFFTCQTCSTCICSDCAKVCKYCFRPHCAESCMKPCSVCKVPICAIVCLSKCEYCSGFICPKGQQCTSICGQCGGLHCKGCTMACYKCKSNFCQKFMVPCSKCRKKACFRCIQNCFVCNVEICCPDFYHIAGYTAPQPFCSVHAEELVAKISKEDELWISAAYHSALKKHDLELAIRQLIIAFDLGKASQDVIEQNLIHFIKNQSTFRGAIFALKYLGRNLKVQDRENVLSWLFELTSDYWSTSIARGIVPPNVGIAVLRQTKHIFAEHCDNLHLDPKTFRSHVSAIDKLLKALFVRVSNEMSCLMMKTALTQAITAGNLDMVIAATKDISEDKQPFLEAAISALLESKFEDSLAPNKRPLFEVVLGIFYFKQARSDKGSYATSFLHLEDAFWKGWVELDHDKLCEILISSYAGAIHGDDGMERGEMLKHLLDQSSEDAKIYKFFYVEPAALKPPTPNELWRGIQLRNRDMLPIRKFEMAIRKSVEVRKTWTSLEAALGYTDMLELCQSPIETVTCFINAALWALQSIEEAINQHSLPKEIYARCKFLTLLVDAAISRAMSPLIMLPVKLYTARICGLIVNRAGTLTHFKRFSKRLVAFYNLVLFYAPYVPSLLAPIVCVGDSNTLQIGYFMLYSKYLQRLEAMGDGAEKLLGSDFKAKLAYFQYELQFILSNSDSEEALKKRRATAMNFLLESNGGMTQAQIRHFMNSPLSQRDSNGWLARHNRLLANPATAKLKFRSIGGVKIDFKKNEISLIGNSIADDSKKAGYIVPEDIATCFSLGIAEPHPFLYFSLETPTQSMMLHPYKECRFLPQGIRNSLVLHSLIQADLILKQLTTGVEISAEPPHEVRSNHDGLLIGLAEHFVSKSKGILRSLRERGGNRISHLKMWIQADEIGYNVVSSGDDGFRLRLSDVSMAVRFKPIFYGFNDDEVENQIVANVQKEHEVSGDDDPLKATKEFCSDLTAHYEQLCDVFPEFRRLKEICKLFACLRCLYGINARFKDQSQSFEITEERMDEIRREHGKRLATARAEMHAHYEKVLRDLMAQFPATRDSRSYDIVVRSLSNALGMALNAEFDRCTRVWFFKRQSGALVTLIVSFKIRDADPAPSSHQVTAAVRSSFAERAAKLESIMKAVSTLCQKQRDRHFGASKMPEDLWLPTICQQQMIGGPNDAERGVAIVHGAILLGPRLRWKEMPDSGAVEIKLSEDNLNGLKFITEPCPPSIARTEKEPKLTAKTKTLYEICDDFAKRFALFDAIKIS